MASSFKQCTNFCSSKAIYSANITTHALSFLASYAAAMV